MELPDDLHGERYCTLSTEGRVTGRRHIAELWFIPTEGGVFLMSGSGGLTQWCLNLQSEERAVLRVAGRGWLGRASFLGREDTDRERALWAFHEKYDPDGKDRFGTWMRNAQVVHLVLTREVT